MRSGVQPCLYEFTRDVLGRPVLAADIPGNRSLVRHGETGWLFRDEQEFRELLLMILHHPEMAGECGSRAQQIMAHDYSPVLEAEHHLSVYISLL